MYKSFVAISDVCSCYNCMCVYPTKAITEYTGKDASEVRQALCPYCGIDAVVHGRLTDAAMLSLNSEMFATTKL